MNYWLPEKLKFKKIMINFLRVMAELGLLLFMWHPWSEGTMGDTDCEFGKKLHTLWVFWCISPLDIWLFLQKTLSVTSECLNSWWFQRENAALLGILQRSSPRYSLALSVLQCFCVQRSGLLPHQLHGKKTPNNTNFNCSYLCSYHMPSCIFNS